MEYGICQTDSKLSQNPRYVSFLQAALTQIQVSLEVKWCVWIYSHHRLGNIVRPLTSGSSIECSHYDLSKRLELFSQLHRRLQYLHEKIYNAVTRRRFGDYCSGQGRKWTSGVPLPEVARE